MNVRRHDGCVICMNVTLMIVYVSTTKSIMALVTAWELFKSITCACILLVQYYRSSAMPGGHCSTAHNPGSEI